MTARSSSGESPEDNGFDLPRGLDAINCATVRASMSGSRTRSPRRPLLRVCLKDQHLVLQLNRSKHERPIVEGRDKGLTVSALLLTGGVFPAAPLPDRV